MPTMDEAMAKLGTAVEAAKTKAADDAVEAYKAANPPVDPTAAASEQEGVDAGKVEAFADTLNPPAPPEG